MFARRSVHSRREPRRILRYRTVSAFLADYDQNLSRGAAFVNSRQPLAVGSRVRLTIALGRKAVREVEGRVTRTAPFGNVANEAPGMHIALTDPQPLHGIASRIRETDSDAEPELPNLPS